MEKELHDNFDDETSMSVAKFKVFSLTDVATKNLCVEQMENAANVELKPCTNVDDPRAIGVVKIEPINRYNESDDRDVPMYYDRSGDDLTMRDCLVKQESMCTDEIEIGEVKIEPVESDYTEHEEHYREISRTSCNVLSDQSLSVQARTQQESQSEILSMPIEEVTSVVSMNTTKLKWKLLRKRLYNAKMVAKQSCQKHAEELARRRPRYETERFGTDAQGEKQQSKMISLPTYEGTSSDSVVKCSQESMNTTKLERVRKSLQRRLNYAKRVAEQSPQKHAEELARRRARYETQRFGTDAQGEKQPSKMISLPTDEGTSSDSIVKCSQEHAGKLARRRERYKKKRDLEKLGIQEQPESRNRRQISTSTDESTISYNIISNMFDKTTRDTKPTYCEHQASSSAIDCVQSSDPNSSAQAEKQPKTQSEILSMPVEVATSVVSINTTKYIREQKRFQYRLHYAKRVAKQTPQEHAEVLARRRARHKMKRDLERSDLKGYANDNMQSSDKRSSVHAEQQQKTQSEILSMPIEETTSDVSNKTNELKRERRRPKDHLRYVQKVAKQSPQEHAEELARRRARYKMKRDLERSSLKGSANDIMQSTEQNPSVQADMQHDSESTVVKMPIDKDTNSESSMHAYVECLEGGHVQDNTQTSGLIEKDPLDTTKQSYDCQECGKPFTREAKLKSHSCYRKGKVR